MHTNPGNVDTVRAPLPSAKGIPYSGHQLYVPPSGNVQAAAELVANTVKNLQGKYPDAPMYITGNFNNCRLDGALSSFQQFVDVPTRKRNSLDLCNGNITDTYTSRVHPTLCFADQNVIFLLLIYRQLLNCQRLETYSTWQWSEGAIAQLQGCRVFPVQTGTFLMVTWKKGSLSSQTTSRSVLTLSFQLKQLTDFQTPNHGLTNK